MIDKKKLIDALHEECDKDIDKEIMDMILEVIEKQIDLIVAYLCDGNACENKCIKGLCHHTVQIEHAVNFEKYQDDTYFENMPKIMSGK